MSWLGGAHIPTKKLGMQTEEEVVCPAKEGLVREELSFVGK
jgi:hypothetical protein